MWLRIPGFFFHRGASSTAATYPADGLHIPQELLSAPSHGVAIQTEELGNVFVTAVAALEGFEPCIEPTLALVEGGQEQQDSGFGLLDGQLGVLQQQAQGGSGGLTFTALADPLAALGCEVHIAGFYALSD
jgi:hypothetical protein